MLRITSFNEELKVDKLLSDPLNYRLHEPISFHRKREGVIIDVALQWTAYSNADTILGYANSIRTSGGGTHLDGMKAAVTCTLNTLGRKSKTLKEKSENLSGDHAFEGLTCVVAMKIPNPEFLVCGDNVFMGGDRHG